MRHAHIADAMAHVDLVDPKTHARTELADFWRRMRAEHPVYWYPARGENPGFWVISRHADVMAVYRDNARFTSERGNVLVTLLAGGDSAAGRMLPVTDGMRHKEIRGAVLRAVSARTEVMQQKVRETTRRIVAAAVERGECEFATAVAEPLSCSTISELIGVPEPDRDDVLSWSRCAVSSYEPDQSPEAVWTARNELLRYFRSLVGQRRAHPVDDVISTLTRSDINGEPLSDDDIVMNCYSLVLGGDETARISMTDAVFTLSRWPDQWALLHDGRVSLESAAEEVLRWATPAMTTGRTALADVELGGQVIRAGDPVTLWNLSANRDETVFTDPYRYDLARSPNKHVSFGYGPHFCLGAHLGRIELREMLDALRTYCGALEVTGPPRKIHSNFMRGMCRLPVRLHPRR